MTSTSGLLISTSSPLAIFIATTVFFNKWQRHQNDTESATARESTCNVAVDSRSKSVLEVITARRSIFPKQYSPSKPVPRDILDKMLEAARWAPTHQMSQPWYFIVFETEQSRRDLGQFLAEHYKKTAIQGGKEFLQTKYEKKIKSALDSTYVIALCVRRDEQSKIPEAEDVCSVAMAVQNMHLVATEYGVGAYWSSGSVFDPAYKKERAVVNPEEVKEFLQLPTPESFCLGWFYVGNYEGKVMKGRREPMDSAKVARR